MHQSWNSLGKCNQSRWSIAIFCIRLSSTSSNHQPRWFFKFHNTCEKQQLTNVCHIDNPGYVKGKWTLVFMPVVEVTYKHNKNIVDTMDKVNIIQLDINNNYTKFQEKTFKVHLIFEKTWPKKLQDEQKHCECFIQSKFCDVSCFHPR
jgi:hypothetical protein